MASTSQATDFVAHAVRTPSQWRRLLSGLIAVFLLFHWSATALGSDRGQAGLIVGAIVMAATLTATRLAFGTTVTSTALEVGLGKPAARGMAGACAISLLLLLVVPAFIRFWGGSASLTPDAVRLLPGLFAQAGIAEEVLFRGYLFGHLRTGRTFRGAAGLAMLPFVGIHTLLFFTMPWPVALAALLLSVVLSFPFAYLFELAGHTIWAPALLHFVIQGTIKVLMLSGESSRLFPFVWMGFSAALPMLAFLIPRSACDAPRSVAGDSAIHQRHG